MQSPGYLVVPQATQTSPANTDVRRARSAADEYVAQATLSKSKLYHFPPAKKCATEPRQ
jgi:hypothetical protein